MAKKYYWLKLKQDFFEDDVISWIEEQENGKDYIIFYLKLCLKSIKNEGTLVRKVGDMLIPYDKQKLSEITNTPVDTVIVALELFKKLGLINILENGEIYIYQMENMIGSETDKAQLMRNKREKDKQLIGNNVTKMLPKCYTEIEIKKEIEKDLKKNNNKKDNVEVEDFFESIWNLYPNKKGKNKVSTKSKKELSKLGFDTIKEVIERYKIAKPDWQHYQNGSTFFNGGYIDYLEQNYKEPESEYIPTSYYYKEC